MAFYMRTQKCRIEFFRKIRLSPGLGSEGDIVFLVIPRLFDYSGYALNNPIPSSFGTTSSAAAVCPARNYTDRTYCCREPLQKSDF